MKLSALRERLSNACKYQELLERQIAPLRADIDRLEGRLTKQAKEVAQLRQVVAIVAPEVEKPAAKPRARRAAK